MPSPIKPMIALAAGVLLAGCAAGPDFKRPPAPNLTGYTMQGDDAVAPAVSATVQAGAWWRAFNAPVLDGVMVVGMAPFHRMRWVQLTPV